MSRLGSSTIPEAFYRGICASLPVFCVDVVAEDARGRFIVVGRRNYPARGKWWVPGGRVLKNERVGRAAVRKLKEETGIRGKFERVIGFYEFFAARGPFEGVDVHTPIAVCLVSVPENSRVRLDSQSAAFQWVAKPMRDMHPDLRRIILSRARRGV